MRLLLINPSNPLVSFRRVKWSPWNRYHIWKPLGLLTLASLTPPEWKITVVDENLLTPDYKAMPRPDLVGITAFTSQAERAYSIATEYRSRGVPVVMGGIHATMCLEEASQVVDAVVAGEAESVWMQVLEDVKRNILNKVYRATRPPMDCIPPARHDLLPRGYHMGSIQITRGCPLNCSFCSVTAFNGGRYRRRPIEKVLEEFKLIREKHVFIVDDNLIGIGSEDISFCKNLFRAMINAKIPKKWIAQVTVNMADDEELLHLASQAGCVGIEIGFESDSREGLLEIEKGYYARPGRDFQAAVRRIQRHGILVAGGFMIGLDVHERGVGKQIAIAAENYCLDVLNATFLTPLPGTRLWEKMQSEQRIVCNQIPQDWKYYTLEFPVVRFMNLSWTDILEELKICYRTFYSYPRLLKRVFRNLLEKRKPITTLGVNLSCRQGGLSLDRKIYPNLELSRGESERIRPTKGFEDSLHS
jgi:radical SAM superfamily enzyme YgiQ (UPF0313 family)